MEKKYIKPNAKVVKLNADEEMLADSITYKPNEELTGSQIGAKESIVEDNALPQASSVWDD
jgi:hypothetical protein